MMNTTTTKTTTILIMTMMMMKVNAYVVVDHIPRWRISQTMMIPQTIRSIRHTKSDHHGFERLRNISFRIHHHNNDNIRDDGIRKEEEEFHDGVATTMTKQQHNGLSSAMIMGSMTSWFASIGMAYADSPDWGLFEGRTGSLLHPVVMSGLFLATLYTGYLGLQWKRQRTIGEEINALKKTVPSLPEGTEPDGNYLLLESQIKTLQDERKALAELGPRDKHFAQGSFLAFLGTAFAIEGCLNTYGRAGKLFPGPHLFAGAALVVCWSIAVATVPSMIKGNDVSRKIHVGANIVGLGLFGWQVVTGLPILFKVWELTKWP